MTPNHIIFLTHHLLFKHRIHPCLPTFQYHTHAHIRLTLRPHLRRLAPQNQQVLRHDFGLKSTGSGHRHTDNIRLRCLRRARVNDVVLHPGKSTKMIEFELYIDGQFVCSQKADGLIIATPTHGRDPMRAGFRLRRMAVEYGIACVTSIDTAKLLMKCVKLGKKAEDVPPLGLHDLIL